MPDTRDGKQQAPYSETSSGCAGKGKGIKRSGCKGSFLNGFDDTEVEA